MSNVASPRKLPRKPLVARDMAEHHRVASALELLFDLCFVVAVAQAAAGLHHSYVLGHLDVYLVNYAFVFFAIWWAWMNFTWFASAYDNDSVAYRLLVAMQIAGVLIVAAGVPRAFDHRDAKIMTLGYMVMRVAQGTQWLRVAKSDPARKVTALRYGGGQLSMQLGWGGALLLPNDWYLPFVVVLILLELSIPVWAEMAEPTTWHPHHIAERYSLFFLIVLGEAILGTTVAIQSAIDSNIGVDHLLPVIVCGFVVVFSMWWLYFFRSGADFLKQGPIAFAWGYGHYLIFAATAAVGAGLESAVDTVIAANTHPATDSVGEVVGGHGESALRAAEVVAHGVSETAAHFQLAIPIAIFLIVLSALHWPDTAKRTWHHWQLTITAALILLASFFGAAYWLIALLIATTVGIKVVSSARRDAVNA